MQQLRTLPGTRPNVDSSGSSAIAPLSNLFSSKWSRLRPPIRLSSSKEKRHRKRTLAHAIHNASQRCGRAFIKLNCAAIPLDLLESELFGHEKGAFTGAHRAEDRALRMADKGTLFLDESATSPRRCSRIAARAARAGIERLGSGRTHKVDVRLVAATIGIC